jgi:isocitrate dehydrogenase
VVPKAGTYDLVFTPADGSPKEVHQVYDFKTPGVIMGMYNTDEVCTGPQPTKPWEEAPS